MDGNQFSCIPVRMKFKRRYLRLIVIVFLYSAWAVTSVSAHALLVRSNPAANAVLAQPPVQVELFFSESVSETLSNIKVYNTSGGEVDVGDVRVDPSDPTRMTVSLHSLNDGVYTVTWKAVSAIDGHQTQGTFPFAVGNINPSSLPSGQQTTSSSLPISALIAKWLLLASLALLTGQFAFITFVWHPALKLSNGEVPSSLLLPKSWVKLYWIGLAGTVLAFILGVLAQAGQVNGNELALPWARETGKVLVETRLGVLWLDRLALALIGVWLIQRPIQNWKPSAGFVVGLALLLTVSLTSHAATEQHPLFPVLDDWTHLIGMTFWFGGLAYLLSGLRTLKGLEDKARTRLTSILAGRFSSMALVSVLFIGLTGLYSAWLRVGSISALLSSIYGHAMLLKQVFVAALLCIAGINLLFFTPLLNRARLSGAGNSTLVVRFGKMVLVEIMVAGLLLASVSLLTYLPPAKIASITSDLTGSKKVDDLRVEIDISPGHVGQNNFMLMLASDGKPMDSARQVLLRFTPTQANVPPSELQLIGQGGGMFSSKGTYLSLPGHWQVQAVVRRENKFDAFANFDFTVNSPGSANESSTTPRTAGAVIVVVGLLVGLNMLSVSYQPVLRFGLGGLLTLSIVGSGLFFLTRPVQASSGNVNPIPPNGESIAAGKAVYDVHCVPCHGVSGKGDGPLGVVLNPRPADLSRHAIPGVHTDAQLFEWITNGFPGSRMPAWKSQLSDTDRWNLVNFIRTLAPKQ
jgi:copper transport protein